MSSESSSDDMYHCPDCGFEWGGYDRAPPYANCPKCDEAVMRRGRYKEEETGGTDGLKMKAVLPADEVEAGDDIYYHWSGERYLVGDVSVDAESGYTYYALLDRQTREFEQLDRIKPGREATVYTNRPVDTAHSER